MIGYVKDAGLTGRTSTDLPGMNAQLLAWLEAEAKVREPRDHRRTPRRPA